MPSCWPATAYRRPAVPWWVDSLNVRDEEIYDIAFVADNPGIWMDHCHNLEHAADGMVAHLMYEGVTTPYTIGRAHGQPAGVDPLLASDLSDSQSSCSLPRVSTSS